MSTNNIWDAYHAAMSGTSPGSLTGTTTTTSTSSGPFSGMLTYPVYPDPRDLECKIKQLELEYRKALAIANKKDFVISLDGNIEDTKTIFAQALDAAREGCEVTIKITK